MFALHRISGRRTFTTLAAPIGGAALLATVVLGGAGAVAAAQPAPLPVVALPGSSVSLFARGNDGHSNPDAITIAHGRVIVAYSNTTAKDGSDHKSSTIVSYDQTGKLVGQIDLVGHADGMRFDPQSQKLWVLMNNDANPVGYLVDAWNGSSESFTFPPTPHGGGYDDLTFVGGKTYISASNPTLNAAGVNVFPAIDTIVVKNGEAQLTPVLVGNATALDTTTHQSVALNEVDPDSMTKNAAGDVILINQAGTEIVFLHHPGTPQQSVSRIPTGTQLEDTLFPSGSEATFYVVDGKQNAIYTLKGEYKPGTVFTEAPSDSGVGGWVGTLNVATGDVTPIAIGFGSPTGLLFASGEDDVTK